MTDEVFIRLLNLYIDREATPTDVEQLEAEIASSRERQSIYAQYCRMQRACELIYQRECYRAPDSAKLLAFESPAQGKPVSAWSRTAAWWGSASAVGLAAAAVFSFVQMRQSVTPNPISNAGSIAATEQPVRASGMVKTSSTGTAAFPAAPQYQSVIALRENGVVANNLAASPSTSARLMDWSWSDREALLLSTPRDQDLRFEDPAVAGNPSYQPATATWGQDKIEFTAFQFQR